MRIAIYTNRLPYPPTGGIPRFLNGFSETLRLRRIDIEFFIPNLIDSTKTSRSAITNQQSIEMYFESEILPFAGSSSAINPHYGDALLSLSEWTLQEPWQHHTFHALHNQKPKEVVAAINSFDMLIVAGSYLLLLGEPDLLDILQQTDIPIVLILLTPLKEVDFYFGPIARNFVADRLTDAGNFCSCVVVPSDYVKQEINEQCGIIKPIIKLAPGINLEQYRDKGQQPEKRKNVISISRLGYFAQHKNIDCLMQAWPFVREHLPEASLILVGAQSANELLERPSDQSGIQFMGEISDVDKIHLLHQSSLLALPSAIEAFGFSFCEGLAAGIPVIGLRCTAVPEIVNDSQNGFLINPVLTWRSITNMLGTFEVEHEKPAIEELASMIIRILEDESTLMELKYNCPKSIEGHDWDKVIDNYLALLRDIQA